MQNNPEIEQITDYAITLAKRKHHEYVILEHLFLSLVSYDPFSKVLVKFGIDVENLIKELDTYLDRIESKNIKNAPKKTNAIERVFNRAVTQVLFTGRRYVTTIDLFLSITAENNSHASYYILKYGIDKNKFTEFWN